MDNKLTPLPNLIEPKNNFPDKNLNKQQQTELLEKGNCFLFYGRVWQPLIDILNYYNRKSTAENRLLLMHRRLTA